MKFKKAKQHKARDRMQSNYISQDWDDNVYPSPIVKSNKSKEVKVLKTREELKTEFKKIINKVIKNAREI